MTAPIQEELRTTLEADPESLRSSQLMEELFWKAVGEIELRKKDSLAQLANATASIARLFFSRAPLEPGTWQLWYAGQMQGIAGLIRIMLSRRLALETSAALRSRKHFIPILETLAASDLLRVSDIAKTKGLDESQVLREIRELERHNLVETVKTGRELWNRITAAGRTALSEACDSAREAPEDTGGGTNQSGTVVVRRNPATLLRELLTRNTGESPNTGELRIHSARMTGSMGVTEEPVVEAAA